MQWSEDMETKTETKQVSNEEKLLESVTEAAKVVHSDNVKLAVLITQCCDEDVDREEVVDAIVDAGWSASRARSVVSSIYIGAGKRARKAGAGRKTPEEAIELANYARKKMGSKSLARQMLLAAYRYLRNSATK